MGLSCRPCPWSGLGSIVRIVCHVKSSLENIWANFHLVAGRLQPVSPNLPNSLKYQINLQDAITFSPSIATLSEQLTAHRTLSAIFKSRTPTPHHDQQPQHRSHRLNNIRQQLRRFFAWHHTPGPRHRIDRAESRCHDPKSDRHHQ